MNKFLLLIIGLGFLTSCVNVEETHIKKVGDNDYSLLATVFQQHSPEYKALCLQAYNIASARLIEIKKSGTYKNAPAVVLDIDETVLDNSPFEVKSILENTSYPTYWEEWMNEANARLVPGVKSFLHLADSLGFEVYYISNRKHKYLDVTIKNMLDYNLPNSDAAHIFLKTDESSKKARRNKLRVDREIIMLIGDNLNDFDEVFELSNNDERIQAVKNLSDEFGDKFIVLPNPLYGEWVKAVLNDSNNLSRIQRDSILKRRLRSF